MKRMAAVRLLSAICVFSLGYAQSSAQAVTNQQTVLDQARKSYYSLRAEGLDSFTCSVTPNWEMLLAKERNQNPEQTDAAIKTLNQLHFSTRLGPDGSVKVTHNELTGQSKQMNDALAQMYGGMEQMASGFFDTWKLFMLTSPFPELSSHYQIENVGSQYRLTYKEDTADVVTSMARRDFAITDLQVTTPQFHSTIQPVFTHTSKGLRLSGYQATYQSQKPEEATQLKVSMDYQEVDGLSMLQKLSLSGSYGGDAFSIELAFTGCQVTRKPTSTAAR